MVWSYITGVTYYARLTKGIITTRRYGSLFAQELHGRGDLSSPRRAKTAISNGRDPNNPKIPL